MCKVFLDVNVLGALPAAYDVVSPFNASSIVFIHWGLLLFCKPIFSRRLRMYRTSVASVDAEWYSVLLLIALLSSAISTARELVICCINTECQMLNCEKSYCPSRNKKEHDHQG
jgi:hypothetical protein